MPPALSHLEPTRPPYRKNPGKKKTNSSQSKSMNKHCKRAILNRLSATSYLGFRLRSSPSTARILPFRPEGNAHPNRSFSYTNPRESGRTGLLRLRVRPQMSQIATGSTNNYHLDQTIHRLSIQKMYGGKCVARDLFPLNPYPVHRLPRASMRLSS